MSNEEVWLVTLELAVSVVAIALFALVVSIVLVLWVGFACDRLTDRALGIDRKEDRDGEER